MAKIEVLNKEITIYNKDEADYICITDIARYKSSDRTDDLIRNWIRNRNTIEFLGIWEHLYNTGLENRPGSTALPLHQSSGLKRQGPLD